MTLLHTGCTDDPPATTTVAAASVRAVPAEQAQAVATPARPAKAQASPDAPFSQPMGIPPSPVVATLAPLPQPATPDPNASVDTTLTSPLPSADNDLPFTVLARVDLSQTATAPSGATVITSQAGLTAFLRQLTDQPASAVSGVDFTTQEVLAIYDPGSVDPSSGCSQRMLEHLVNGGSGILWELALGVAFGACSEDSPSYAPSLEFVSFAKTATPVLNATVWTGS